MHRVPHTVTCTSDQHLLVRNRFGRGPTDRAARRAALDAKVRELFGQASGRTWTARPVSTPRPGRGRRDGEREHRRGLDARSGLAGPQDQAAPGVDLRKILTAPKFPDLVHRGFTAPAPNVKRRGDITEIPTDEGKLYFASLAGSAFAPVAGQRDLGSSPCRTWPAMRSRWRPLARGGRARYLWGDLSDTDRGSTYTATCFTTVAPNARAVGIDGQGRFMFR